MLKLILVAIIFLLFSVAGYADVYVWRDAQGVVNYSDTPPPEDARDVKILRIPRQHGMGGAAGRAETRQQGPATAGGAGTGTGSRGSAPSGATTAAGGAPSSGGAGGVAGGGGSTSGGGAAGGGADGGLAGGGTPASGGGTATGGTTTAGGGTSTSGGTTTAGGGTPTAAGATTAGGGTSTSSGSTAASGGGTSTSGSTTTAGGGTTTSGSATAPSGGGTTTGGTTTAASSPTTTSGGTATPVAVTPPAPTTAQRLFASGFEGATAIVPPNQANFWGTGGWTDITGTDGTTGFTWPPNIWGGGGGRFLFLTDPLVVNATAIGSYMFNRIETVTGPKGNQTRALYQQISRNVNGTEPMGTSPTTNLFGVHPSGETSDLYISYWVRFQPDLVEKMNNLPAGPGINNGGTWRAFFAFKTGGQKAVAGPLNDPMNNGDYRVEVYVMTYGGGTPYWQVLADNNAGGGAPLVNNWSVQNRAVPVPVGEWFKFEIFWHRSNGADGRVWVAVNGNVICDRYGPNMGAWNLPINRISMPTVYTGSRMPVYQWIDDLEIWDGFPPDR